jgi:mannose-1-phosphate guanylyltransferase/mannose-1-phosphate guanylyltransferase/mannose-6-phosphate isomerase
MTEPTVPKIRPVILSGGEGKRLWPLSSADRPKQFLSLVGEETLLQQTVRRLADPAMFEAPIIVGGDGQRRLIADQLLAAGLEAQRIVLEPEGRNTGPALAVGALLAYAEDPAVVILSAHADHAIADGAAFRDTVQRGLAAAEAGRLVLFGIKPTFASTAYGYIVPGEPLECGARSVALFLEKPALADAEALTRAGCVWNSGLFLMRADRLIGELEAHAPEILSAARAAIAAGTPEDTVLQLDPAAFAAAPKIAIDHAVFERTSNAAVIDADFAWSDIGSWSSVWESQAQDDDGNAASGPVVLKDVASSLVLSTGPEVAVCGVRDLVVVATPTRVLVIAKSQDQQVRDLAQLSGAN